MKNLVAILACTLFLSGCAGVAGVAGGYIKAYEVPERPDAELAILVSPRRGTGGPIAYLGKVDDETYGDDVLKGWPLVTKVLPGEHRIYMKCHMNTLKAFGTVTRTFQAGRYYELACVNLGTGYVNMNIIDRGATNPFPQ